ncbi:MAG: hypothetical protein AAGF71_02670 [Pseudomonadota bacterium]
MPAHHLTDLTLLDDKGEEVCRLELHAPVEENPSLTFLLPPDVAAGPVHVRPRDNMGYRFEGRMEPGA